jgi:hypothetical protein
VAAQSVIAEERLDLGARGSGGVGSTGEKKERKQCKLFHSFCFVGFDSELLSPVADGE